MTILEKETKKNDFHDFSVIFMKTKNDSNLYLGDDEYGNKIWSFDINEAIWFDEEKEATNFAKKYFKSFDKWKVKEIRYNSNNNKIF